MFTKYFINYFTVFLLMISPSLLAEINTNRPPFSLTLSQVEQWSPTSIWADKRNVSSVALQKRIHTDLGNQKMPLDKKVKVLIAPDGMNNLANYIEEQSIFNLYNFTHWSHIDVLNWFAGTANETVNLPSKPWVETAHRNGVKVIGTVYLSVAQYGGDVLTVTQLLQQDKQGGFPLARKLVEIAQFYGFDGWLINPETDLTQVKNAQGDVIKGQFETKNAAVLGLKMQQFMRYLTEISPEQMEIHWYDSMLLDGSVKWQNELNTNNSAFFQGINQQERYSDAMFMNYWWDGEMVANSHDYVTKLNRSPYELYFGADLSPERNAQQIYTHSDWLKNIFSSKDNQALSSIALFGNDVTYTFTGDEHTPAYSKFRGDKMDYRRFYDSETRLFAGNDLNIYTDDADNEWPGIGRYVPAKSTLINLPFSTSFNTGHGLFKARQGKKIAGEWHDISQQDILPTWQFAIEGDNKTTIYYDFEYAYQGGSSLAIDSEASVNSTNIPLYQSGFILNSHSKINITYQYQLPTTAVQLWLEMADGDLISIALTANSDKWLTKSFSLASYADRVVSRIGFGISEHRLNKVSIKIGQMEIH
ncbi:MAG: endo-beta-N-acetylglucosaminidase D [Alteromonadaceae bacterium]|jgi:endo-beta-N-acetylglucosaminidase D